MIGKEETMSNKTIQTVQMWTTIPETQIDSYAPNTYLRLLSALDNGWHIGKVELAPSWDQHGFVYLVTLHLHTSALSQQLIIPKNPLVENLLDSYQFDICSLQAMGQPLVV